MLKKAFAIVATSTLLAMPLSAHARIMSGHSYGEKMTTTEKVICGVVLAAAAAKKLHKKFGKNR